MYEQVIFEQLPNRSVASFMGVYETPDQAYVVLYQLDNGKWWNAGEYQDEQGAIDNYTFMKPANPSVKIVVAVKAIPVVVEEEIAVVVEAPAEIEVAPQMPETIATVEPAESDNIRVHIACYPVNGIVWTGNDLSKAKEVFDRWTKNHQVGQASVQFRHTDGSGWSIQYNNPALYWDRHDEYLKAQATGLPFFGVRA